MSLPPNRTWDEAFHRAGFDYGHGGIHSEIVEAALRRYGCTYVVIAWGGSRKNHYISRLVTAGGELLTFDGVTNPATKLPAEIVAALNQEFGPAGTAMEWKA
jgi:hypothetical protein